MMQQAKQIIRKQETSRFEVQTNSSPKFYDEETESQKSVKDDVIIESESMSASETSDDARFDKDEDQSVDEDLVIVGFKNFDEALSKRFKQIVKEVKELQVKQESVGVLIQEKFDLTQEERRMEIQMAKSELQRDVSEIQSNMQMFQEYIENQTNRAKRERSDMQVSMEKFLD